MLKRSNVERCMYHIGFTELDFDLSLIERRWSNGIVREHAHTLSSKGIYYKGFRSQDQFALGEYGIELEGAPGALSASTDARGKLRRRVAHGTATYYPPTQKTEEEGDEAPCNIDMGD